MTVHTIESRYGEAVPLADTPKTWPDNPGISTLHVLLLFVGIPLLVIIVVSLLILAPGWGKAQRYRPGQPWAARTEWFGGAVAVQPGGTAGVASPAERVGATDRHDPDTGGASAGW